MGSAPSSSTVVIRSSPYQHVAQFRRSNETRESVAAGGLMSYGTSLTNGYRQVDIYTDESSKVISPLTYGRAP
jgi:hypothetical protein